MKRFQGVSSLSTIENANNFISNPTARKIAGVTGTGLAVLALSSCSSRPDAKEISPSTPGITSTTHPNSGAESTTPSNNIAESTTTTDTSPRTATNNISQLPNLTKSWLPNGYDGYFVNAQGLCVATSVQVESQPLPMGCQTEQASHTGVTAADLTEINFNTSLTTQEMAQEEWIINGAGECITTPGNNDEHIQAPTGCSGTVVLSKQDLAPVAQVEAIQPGYEGWAISGAVCVPLAQQFTEAYKPVGC